LQQLQRGSSNWPGVQKDIIAKTGCCSGTLLHNFCGACLQVVKQAYKLRQSTPPYAQLGQAAFTPLPAAADGATYPTFNEYPVGSVELQQLERRRIQEAEDALLRRRRVSRLA
jgi:hypothetical protein